MKSSSGLKQIRRKTDYRGSGLRFPQGFVDGGQELLVIDGFLEKGIGARFQGPILVHRRIACGHDDNRNVSQMEVGLQTGHSQVAVPSGQTDVQKDQVGLDLESQLHGEDRIGGQLNVKSAGCQDTTTRLLRK